jgi:hypothetical protein
VDVPGPAGDEARPVWSPVLRRHARVPAAEARLLRRFSHGARLSALTTRDTSDLLRLYLRVQKFLALGILVEELVLGPEQLGDVHVGAVPAEIRPDGTFAPGREPLRLRDLCHRRSAPHAPNATLRVCRRPDGHLALLDDAQAGCAAVLRGRPQRVQVLHPADFVRRAVDAPAEFFGTLRGDVPYQSIWCDGHELVAGRRRALYERMSLVRPADLDRRAVLELGCNIGMNCYLAVELGARAATGVDGPALASAAARLNGFYGRRCRFVSADVNAELTGLGPHETVLVFSVLGHLRSADGVLNTIEHARARAIYVETHRDGDFQGDLDRLLCDRRFRRVELLGRCENSAYEGERSRRFYRCEVRRAWA